MLYLLNDDPLVPDDPHRDPQEMAFLHSVVENPDDDAPRLIFADWLEEQGMTDKAAFVRLEVEFSRLPKSSERYSDLRDELLRLDEAIGGQWGWAFVRPGRLLNCGEPDTKDRTLRFVYECPNRWADLTPLPEKTERFCDECQKNVHFCASKEEAEAHAVQGHCIAIGSLLALAIKNQYRPETAQDPLSTETHLAITMGLIRDLDDAEEMGEGSLTGKPYRPPLSPYQLWAEELFARHPSAAKRWWQFWK